VSLRGLPRRTVCGFRIDAVFGEAPLNSHARIARVSMSERIDKSWLVFVSIENFEHDRCVDLFSRPDGSYGFEEFRRDVEDRGDWTPVQLCVPRTPCVLIW
jgi:hypothetical protein